MTHFLSTILYKWIFIIFRLIDIRFFYKKFFNFYFPRDLYLFFWSGQNEELHGTLPIIY